MTDDKKRKPIKGNDIEHFKWLYGEARKRLESRRAVEWKLFIGTWTALLATAGLIVSMDDPLPSWSVFVAGYGALWVVVACICFERWLMKNQNNDARLGYWYSSAIEYVIRAKTPGTLQPGWKRFMGDGKEGENEPFMTGIQVFKLSVTAVLSCLFVLTARLKATDWSLTDSDHAEATTAYTVIAILIIVAAVLAYRSGRRSERVATDRVLSTAHQENESRASP